MKKLVYFTALLLVFASISCKKEQASMKLQPDAVFYIKGSARSKATSIVYPHLSNLEIVKLGKLMPFHNTHPFFGAISDLPNDSSYVIIGGWQAKDTTSINPAFLMAGYQVITQFGFLADDYIASFDVVICAQIFTTNDQIGDTLAYIPNSQMRVNESLIRAAYANNDINAVYDLFENGWTFTPCTGAEYLALKKAGNN